MIDNPLVSVIIPVYNGEKFLGECIESIVGQTYQKLDIIIVNDGSTDRTDEIVRKYAAADDRINYISTANRGVSAARNLAINDARGEYITFVDADDRLDKNFVEILIGIIEKTGADVAVAGFTHDERNIGFTGKVGTYDGKEFTIEVLYQQLSDTAPWGKLIKTELLKEEKFMDMRYEDLELLPRLYLKSRLIAHTDSPLYFYRIHGENFFNKWSEARLDVLKALTLIEKTIEKTGESAELRQALTSRRLAASFNIFFITYGRAGYEKVADDMWRYIKSTRRECLKNPKVIRKIKTGIIASYAGKKGLHILNRLTNMSR